MQSFEHPWYCLMKPLKAPPIPIKVSWNLSLNSPRVTIVDFWLLYKQSDVTTIYAQNLETALLDESEINEALSRTAGVRKKQLSTTQLRATSGMLNEAKATIGSTMSVNIF